MAGEVIKEFLVSLGFKVDSAGQKGFTDGIGKATLAVAGIGAATVAAAGAISGFVHSVAKEIDLLGDLGDRTNIAVSEIERLDFAAVLAGGTAGAFKSSLESFNRTMGQAALGVGRGAMTFEKFGLSAKKVNGEMKTTTEMFSDVSAYIKDMSRQEQMGVLQRLGLDPSLIGMLTTDMAALTAEYDALAGSVGYNADEAALLSANFMDAKDRIKYAIDVLRKSIAMQFMPQLTRAMESLRKGMVANLPRIIAIVKPILGGLLKITGAMLQLGGRVAEIIGSIDKKILAGIAIVLLWRNAITLVTKAWAILNSTFLMSPLGIVLALSAAILLLYDDFKVWQEGGESFFNWEPLINGAIRAVVWLTDKVRILTEAAMKAVNYIKELFTFDFSKLTSFSGIKGILDNAFGPGGSGSIGSRHPVAGNATVNQTITQNIQSTDPMAAGRESARENDKAIKYAARYMTPQGAF
ncbi:MAG: phage tail tape measure protein [Deltaproteobacteria bacterium]|nr:phage tail tape measure protein [Deltaproteobacteria bacterium]